MHSAPACAPHTFTPAGQNRRQHHICIPCPAATVNALPLAFTVVPPLTRTARTHVAARPSRRRGLHSHPCRALPPSRGGCSGAGHRREHGPRPPLRRLAPHSPSQPPGPDMAGGGVSRCGRRRSRRAPARSAGQGGGHESSGHVISATDSRGRAAGCARERAATHWHTMWRTRAPQHDHTIWWGIVP